ncbi:MAG: sensor histidine kinase, partial [Romboutsia sp.]|uniref:sensor histidine kinase n=1 Tax=Romboutsia sp. TaxID=1965302 RepID=UPI003F380C99
SFNTMLKRLKSSFEIQKNFSYNAAHELKTPLTVIKSSIDVLELDDNPTIDDYKENVSIVKESTTELIQIVEQLLALSSNEKINKEKTDLKKVILDCLQDYNEDINSKDIEIVTNLDDVEINSNFILLKRIVSNILSNAIKYNNKNGSIVIEILKDINNATVKISDTGIGISKENIDYIFNTFYRVDESRSKQIDGNGLGLSIVKVSLEKLGGYIEVDSTLEVGTDVAIRLPIT